MASSAALRREREQYYALKDNISRSIRKLNESVSNFNIAHKTLLESYTYDSNTLDRNYLQDNTKRISSTGNNLQSRVIPAIDSKITSLTREIELAEAKEAEEAMERMNRW